MNNLKKIVFLAAKVSDRVAQWALVLMMLIITVNIVGRLFKYPISGSLDLISALGGILVSLSIAQCCANKGHIGVTILVDKLHGKVRLGTSLITHFLSIALFGLLAWECLAWGTDVWGSHKTLDILPIPVFPFIYVMGFGSLLLALVLLIQVAGALSFKETR